MKDFTAEDARKVTSEWLRKSQMVKEQEMGKAFRDLRSGILKEIEEAARAGFKKYIKRLEGGSSLSEALRTNKGMRDDLVRLLEDRGFRVGGINAAEIEVIW